MKKIVKELAITGGIYDCICDPYDKLNNGDPYSSVMIDLERFAEKIVKETMQIVANNLPQNTYLDVADAVIEHFGVEE